MVRKGGGAQGMVRKVAEEFRIWLEMGGGVQGMVRKGGGVQGCNARLRRTSVFTKLLGELVRFCQSWKYSFYFTT